MKLAFEFIKDTAAFCLMLIGTGFVIGFTIWLALWGLHLLIVTSP